MIPKAETDFTGIEIKTEPSLTYALDIERGSISGKIDGIESVRQAIYLILSTKRYGHLIYSRNYGTEHSNVIGEDKEYAFSEIKRCIREALLQDDRITEADDFDFYDDKKSVRVTFTVRTIFGDIESEVNI